MIVRIKALVPQLAAVPRLEVEQLQPTVVGPLTEASVGVRVAGSDRYVGGLLDQGQLHFAGLGHLGFRCRGPKQVSKRRITTSPLTWKAYLDPGATAGVAEASF